MIEQLYSTKRSVTAILVAFDMDQMEPYRVRAGSMIDSRVTNWTGEPAFGTQVRYLLHLFDCYSYLWIGPSL